MVVSVGKALPPVHDGQVVNEVDVSRLCGNFELRRPRDLLDCIERLYLDSGWLGEVRRPYMTCAPEQRGPSEVEDEAPLMEEENWATLKPGSSQFACVSLPLHLLLSPLSMEGSSEHLQRKWPIRSRKRANQVGSRRSQDVVDGVPRSDYAPST